MKISKVLVLLVALLPIFFISCTSRTVITEIDHSTLTNGDTIPWEWIIEYKVGTDEKAKRSMDSTFIELMKDTIVKRYADLNGISVDDLTVHHASRIERCFCEFDKSLNSIGILVEENDYSGSLADAGSVEPDDRSCVEGSGVTDSLYRLINPNDILLSLADSLANVVAIRPNIFIGPPLSTSPVYQLDGTIPEADVLASSEEDIIIASIDSGLELDVIREFVSRNRMWKNHDGSDDGCKPSYNVGWNFVNNTSNLTDELRHGTKVTTIIDSLLFLGQCNYKHMILKVFSACYGSSFHASCAIEYAVDHSADVINASWGTYGENHDIKDAVGLATERGIPIICSMGNEQLVMDEESEVPHIPSDLVFNVSKMVVPVAGLSADLLSPWGWGIKSALSTELTPDPESTGGTNMHMNTESISGMVAESAELYHTVWALDESGSKYKSFKGDISGTSFSAPQVSAKIASLNCCSPGSLAEPDLLIHLLGPGLSDKILNVQVADPAAVIATETIGLKMHMIDITKQEECADPL